jgi:hypothetical protein
VAVAEVADKVVVLVQQALQDKAMLAVRVIITTPVAAGVLVVLLRITRLRAHPSLMAV